MLAVGTSEKKMYPKMLAKINSVYRNGAKAEISAALKALKMQNCIKFAPIPSVIKRANCAHDGVTHTKNVNGSAHNAMMTPYSQMNRAGFASEIFLMMISWTANKNVVKMGIKM